MGVRVPPELLERKHMKVEDIYIVSNRIMSHVAVWMLALWYFSGWSVWFVFLALTAPTLLLAVLFFVVIPLTFLLMKGDT